MKKHLDEHGKYVQRVQEDTRKYIEELFSENERLRLANTSLELAKRQGEQQLLAATAELDHARYENEKLRHQFDDIQSERERYYEHYLSLEQQHANLANLYVASFRLHGTLDRTELMGVIQEIVINLIGSEELIVFERGSDDAFTPAVCMGVDEEIGRRLASGDAGFAGATSSGEIWISDKPASADGELSALVPLRADDRVVGMIAIFRLLPQKPGLEPIDRELFDLLGSQAGTALYLTRLHAEARKAAP